MNGTNLANVGDDIYDDMLLRKSILHYIDDGKLTFFATDFQCIPLLALTR